MKKLMLAPLLGVLVVCASAAPAGAVVGGTPVEPASVPWFASLGGCGGTLVAPDRVLTAAHCVNGLTPDAYSSIEVGGVVRNATHIAMHPNWRDRNGTSNFVNDVALIELNAPVIGVTLVTLGGADPGMGHLLGRGRPFAPGTGHSNDEQLDTTLRTADLKTIDDATCAKAFKGYLNEFRETFDPRMRCAVDADGLEPLNSGCFGDSGGPLWTGAADAPVQLGVVSWGGKCGADHRPSVFADVALYRDFITDPSPTWAPTRRTHADVRFSARARVGRPVRCSAVRYAPEAGTRLEYDWKSLGAFHGSTYRPGRLLHHGRAYTPRRADAGTRIACHLSATTAGGAVEVGVGNTPVAR